MAAHHIGNRGTAILGVELDPVLAMPLHRTAREARNRDMTSPSSRRQQAKRQILRRLAVLERGRASSAFTSSDSEFHGRYLPRVARAHSDDRHAESQPACTEVDKDRRRGGDLRPLYGSTQTQRKHRPTLHVEVRRHEEAIRTLCYWIRSIGCSILGTGASRRRSPSLFTTHCSCLGNA